MELKDKVALITGASRGIGLAIAIELAKRGASIFITWTASETTKDSAKVTMYAIKDANLQSRVTGMAVDLREDYAAARLVQECVKHFQHIDIIVDNAGAEHSKDIMEIELSDLRSVLDLNLHAPFFIVQAVLPYLRKPGRIINISSVAARCSPRLLCMLRPKALLEAMTRTMAAAIGEQGHTVNAVEPGLIGSEMMDRITVEIVKSQNAATPVEHRLGRPNDIAQVVAWLASEGSRWISGQTISASGGFTMI